jgi:exodeoxyribonuclease VII small subunit
MDLFTKMAQKSPPAEKPAQTFESAIGRLEEIVVQMEGNELALEVLLERYEEGSRLVKVCQEKLETAERRVEIITRNAAGQPQVSAFEPAAVSTLPPVKEASSAGEVSLF